VVSIVRDGPNERENDEHKRNVRTPKDQRRKSSDKLLDVAPLAGRGDCHCNFGCCLGCEVGRVTNGEIGKLIGLSYSAVSRLRRGERLPSVEVMVAIGEHFSWGVADQVKVRTSQGAKVYAQRLNEAISEKEVKVG
jgi:hypothetical protein